MNKKSAWLLATLIISQPVWADTNHEENAPEVISLDRGSAERISEHLNLSSEDKKKFELVGFSQKATCIPGPAVKDEVKESVNWKKKLNPIWWIGNADDPLPPDWYRPGSKFRKVLWYFRNPFHNFTFYVIGIGDKTDRAEYSRCGKFPNEVFAPGYGWNYSYVKYKSIRLPFVSYWSPKQKLYFGWRERGNIGIKVNISTKPKYK